MTGERFLLDSSILALLSDLQISSAHVLRRAELPAGLFGDGPASLTPAEYFRFWEALAAEGQDPILAVTIGTAISVEMFSPPLFAALSSPNLLAAAGRIAEFKPLVGPMRVRVDECDRHVTIVNLWPVGLRPPALLVVTELVFWVALARIATRHRIEPLDFAAPELPGDSAALTEYLGRGPRIGEPPSVRFSMTDMRRPFLTENEALWRFFAPELRARLAHMSAAESTAERVRAALVETLPAGGDSIETVAYQLAKSSRTLQRQLRNEGTSFQSILADTRLQLAKHYLLAGTLSNAEIAFLLAYDDTNSFYRAFRAWTGTTPDAVRAYGGSEQAPNQTGLPAAGSR